MRETDKFEDKNWPSYHRRKRKAQGSFGKTRPQWSLRMNSDWQCSWRTDHLVPSKHPRKVQAREADRVGFRWFPRLRPRRLLSL